MRSPVVPVELFLSNPSTRRMPPASTTRARVERLGTCLPHPVGERASTVIVERAPNGTRVWHIHDRHPSACSAPSLSKPGAVAVLVLGGRLMNAKERYRG